MWILLLSMLSTVLYGCTSSASIPFPTLPVRFDSSQRVDQALETLDGLGDDKAELIHSVPAAEKFLALTFDGFASSEVLEGVLELLKNHDISATFFLTAVGVAEDEASVKKMVRAGHRVESGTLHSLPNMQEMSSEALVRDFAKSASIIEEATGRSPGLLKCFSTSYTDDVLKAALASGFKSAVKSSSLISYQSFTSYSQVLSHVSSLEWGGILSVKLSGVLSDDEYAPATEIKDEYDPGEPLPSIDEDERIPEELSDEEKLLRTVEWILTAIDETGKKAVYVENLPLLAQFSMNKDTRQEHFLKLREENAGRLAERIDMVYTTEKAVALTFYGISDSAALDNLLNELESLDILGTFFISVDDINSHEGAIEKIAGRGHHLAAAIIPRLGLDYASVCEQIYFIESWLELNHGQKLSIVSQIFNELEPDVQEAASAMGLRLVGSTHSLTSGGTEQAVNASPLLDRVFRSSLNTIMRGSILQIRADFYRKSDTMPAQMVRIISEYALNSAYTADGSDPGESAYKLKPLYDILSNSEYTYSYPVAQEDLLPEVAGAIGPGHLDGMSESEILSYIRSRYIGNPDISSANQIPGFSAAQVRSLDKIGKIDTGKSNTVFLTFDDWGTDRTAAQLLAVLEKHDVKATFFIRTGYVSVNPNLLRAIGAQGHEIASHSDQHPALSNESDKRNVFLSLSDEEAQALQDDVILSYEVLQSIVGDMRNESGNPVLSRIFRPPTLAVSRIGMEAVFDSGYSHIVSGDFSTGDYSAENADFIYSQLVDGIYLDWARRPRTISDGSIIVMHMTDSSQYTPQAVDMFLEWNAARPESERLNFARISDYLD
ncbi:MAG: polysaccharide deacetylase family protein [Christensenellales bacterium]